MLNNNKAILDAPIPPTVVPVTATPLTAVPITTSAPVVVTSAVTLPAPLLPANQAQENKQEIVENYLNSLPPPVTINNIINDRSAIYFSLSDQINWHCKIFNLAKKIEKLYNLRWTTD